MPLRILGIDPGLANTGWAIVDCEGGNYLCVGFGCITTSSHSPVPQRLRTIHEGLLHVITVERPDECAIENVYFSNNARTAFATGQARGVAMLAAASLGLPVEEYGPGEVKQAVTGNGAADKAQVTYMIRAILGLKEELKPHHVADAMALAICHGNGRGLRKAKTAADLRGAR